MSTIAAAVQDIVADIAPEEVDLIPTVTRGFYDSAASRRATVQGVLLGKGHDAALGFGAIETGQLVASITLIVFNGVATNMLSGMTERKLTGLGRWAARRRLARQLTTAAPQAEAAPLPKLTPTEADAIAGLVKHLARTNGLSDDVGTRLAINLAAKLIGAS
ncbi:hypothetical protein AB0C02_13245 [Micromonospora sp. NPDC048999]|uniref:hypothetical protein n=1 Tax=Micromonospora sp. NPDC048999 TaxID=3155391 RepID=UPI0034018338